MAPAILRDELFDSKADFDAVAIMMFVVVTDLRRASGRRPRTRSTPLISGPRERPDFSAIARRLSARRFLAAHDVGPVKDCPESEEMLERRSATVACHPISHIQKAGSISATCPIATDISGRKSLRRLGCISLWQKRTSSTHSLHCSRSASAASGLGGCR
jgi:hypothetical protein